jgi:hypothetical protein
MSDFQGIVTGNIASTPITKTANMSPTEIAAFSEPEPDAPKYDAAMNTSAWEELDTESWTEPGLSASVSNTFRRVTRRMAVDNGYLYSVATYALCYVRGGSANFSSSESLTFVPNSDNAGTAAKSVKPKK